MSQKKNFIQIAESISAITGCSKPTAEAFLKSMFSLLADFIQSGKKVKIKGIGTFCKSENTDEPIIYEPDKNLAETINLPFSSFEAVELDDDVTDDVFKSELNKVNEDSAIEKTLEIEKTSHTIIVENDDKIIADSEELTNNIDEFKVDSETTEENIENPINEESADEYCVEGQHDEPQSETEQKAVNKEEDNPVVTPVVTVAVPVDDNNIHEEEIYDDKLEEYKSHGVGKNIFIISILVALIIGFGAGYMTKLFMDNIELKKPVVMQQSQIDSIKTANTVDTLKINEHKSDSTTPPVAGNNADTIKVVQKAKPTEQPQYDTVKANRFLTTMARQHYGNLNFWVYIYEENQAIMGHPNKIKPGTMVKIPPAEKYGIDANDPVSVQKAKVKAVEIYSRYQN